MIRVLVEVKRKDLEVRAVVAGWSVADRRKLSCKIGGGKASAPGRGRSTFKQIVRQEFDVRSDIVPANLIQGWAGG